jgi:hypothetical protein
MTPSRPRRGHTEPVTGAPRRLPPERSLVTLVAALGGLLVVLTGIAYWVDGRGETVAGPDRAAAEAPEVVDPARPDDDGEGDEVVETREAGDDGDDGDEVVEESPVTSPPLAEYAGWVNPASAMRPWSDVGAVEGLLTFRGNPTRSWYGRGPVPETARVVWTWDIGCANSNVGSQPKTWCGSGWTGQPTVFRHPLSPDSWTVGFGGYNRKVNFLDPDTGAVAHPAYATNDIIKGSITIDPDGFPLLYTGSRDDNFHVVALDRAEPVALWKLHADAHKPTKWNNDWDGNALIIDDYLFEGGENSRFYIVKLNRSYGADGLVTVDPKVVFTTEGWDEQLLRDVGDNNVSIESSVAITGDVVYFANSGGLVQGYDLSGLADGATPTRVFRFWTGDDTDATVVADEEGYLYVGTQYERGLPRARELGQIIKLDPRRADDPVVWSREASSGIDTGVWATPGLWRDLVIVPTHDGRVIGLDRASGAERWVLRLPGPLWQSPVIVDDVLIQGDCQGTLHAFDLGDGTAPPTSRWSVELGGCIESTPAVWDGRIFVGSRNGTFYAVGD